MVGIRASGDRGAFRSAGGRSCGSASAGRSVKEVGFGMMERSAWPSMLIVACAAPRGPSPRPCAAQSPATRDVDGPSARRAAGGRAAVNGVPGHRTLHEDRAARTSRRRTARGTDRPSGPPAGATSIRRRSCRRRRSTPTRPPGRRLSASGRARMSGACRRRLPSRGSPHSRRTSPARRRRDASPLATQREARARRRSSPPTSASRSTWPPPCGSPTPGR